MKTALVVIDMTNDFVYENYQEDGEWHKGKLVVPDAVDIVPRIAQYLHMAKDSGAKPLMIKKDHYNGFTNDKLEKTLKEKGITDVYIVGLVDEICIYHNAIEFLKRGYKTSIIKDQTVPLDKSEGKKSLEKLSNSGVAFTDEFENFPKMNYVLYLEDLHTEESPEIKSGDFPPHNIKNTFGARTVKMFRNIIYPE